MIDLHSHILPGVDDGARTIEDSREIAIAAAADGVTAIAATPHVRADYPTSADQMEQGVAELRRDFRAHEIPVEVLHGGEVALEQIATLGDDELARFTIAQTGRYVLVEFPYVGWPIDLEDRVFKLRVAGLFPLLAHPERSTEVQSNPSRLSAAIGAGTLVQVTAASLDGRLGSSSKRAAEQLLELGYVHVLASDAHTPAVREAGMTAAARALRDAGLARYLTEDVPAAIVAGERVPAAPRTRKRRRFRFL